MKRAIGALFMGCCVGILAGCANLDVFGVLALKDVNGNERVVAGNLDAVVETTKTSLAKLNLKAEVTQGGGGTVYIATATQTGIPFRFVLTREVSPAGEKTRIRVEWFDSRRNEEISFNLLSQVAAQHKN
jgi:hypothetical protein